MEWMFVSLATICQISPLCHLLLHYSWDCMTATTAQDKNSSGDEIANVNFFYNIAHVEVSAYAHSTSS